MKFALLSDPHFTVENPVGRKDVVRKAVENKLNFITDYLIRNGVYQVLIAGDLCDVKRSWELLSLLTEFFRYWSLDNGIKIYAVLGQHDSYFHEMDNRSTVVGVLMSSGLITRLGEIETVWNAPKQLKEPPVHLYGASYGEPVPEPSGAKGVKRVLVIHRMIGMTKMWAGQKGMDFAPDFLKKHKTYDLILCGDAHQSFIYSIGKRRIVNTGPVMRLDATEAMMKHSPRMYMYDTVGSTIATVIIPADKEALSREHINEMAEERANFDSYVQELLDSGRKHYRFSDILKMYIAELEKEGRDLTRPKQLISEVMAESES